MPYLPYNTPHARCERSFKRFAGTLYHDELFSRYLSPVWSRFFAQPAPNGAARPSSQPHRSPTLPVRSRRELEVAWLLRCQPFELQKVLWPDVMYRLLHHPPVAFLATDEYIRPDIPGIIRPRYISGVLAMKTLEGLERGLEEELTNWTLVLDNRWPVCQDVGRYS